MADSELAQPSRILAIAATCGSAAPIARLVLSATPCSIEFYTALVDACLFHSLEHMSVSSPWYFYE